ncbi:MAG: hypothetical protein GKS01_02085 [Alphaproteobacteria bacterium]|nr:hypothetical protein [Alphaproteobacteria bacterium]
MRTKSFIVVVCLLGFGVSTSMAADRVYLKFVNVCAVSKDAGYEAMIFAQTKFKDSKTKKIVKTKFAGIKKPGLFKKGRVQCIKVRRHLVVIKKDKKQEIRHPTVELRAQTRLLTIIGASKRFSGGKVSFYRKHSKRIQGCSKTYKKKIGHMLFTYSGTALKPKCKASRLTAKRMRKLVKNDAKFMKLFSR